MTYILDGAVILIFILAIIIGSHRGFMKSIVQLIGCVLAVLLANMLSPLVAGGLFDTFASDQLQNTLSSSMATVEPESVTEGIGKVLDKLPQPVVHALQAYGLGTPEDMLKSVQDSLTNGKDAVVKAVVVGVIRPVAVSLLRALCFAILFILFMIAVFIIARIIGRVFRLPLLKQMDGLLGAVVGAAEGVLLIFVAVTVIQLIAASSDVNKVITALDIKKTVIVRMVSEHNPLTEICLGCVERITDVIH